MGCIPQKQLWNKMKDASIDPLFIKKDLHKVESWAKPSRLPRKLDDTFQVSSNLWGYLMDPVQTIVLWLSWLLSFLVEILDPMLMVKPLPSSWPSSWSQRRETRRALLPRRWKRPSSWCHLTPWTCTVLKFHFVFWVRGDGILPAWHPKDLHPNSRIIVSCFVGWIWQ